MAYIEINITDKKGFPLPNIEVRCISLARIGQMDEVITSDITDKAGTVYVTVNEPFFPRPMVSEIYKRNIRIFTRGPSANGIMYDYVACANKLGTHEFLGTANGALAQAIADGVDRCIWVCGDETFTDAEELGAIADNVHISIHAADGHRATLTAATGPNKALFKVTTGGTWVSSWWGNTGYDFRNIRLDSNNDTPIFDVDTSPGGTASVFLDNCILEGSTVVDVAASQLSFSLHVRNCLAGVDGLGSVVKMGASSAMDELKIEDPRMSVDKVIDGTYMPDRTKVSGGYLIVGSYFMKDAAYGFDELSCGDVWFQHGADGEALFHTAADAQNIKDIAILACFYRGTHANATFGNFGCYSVNNGEGLSILACHIVNTVGGGTALTIDTDWTDVRVESNFRGWTTDYVGPGGQGGDASEIGYTPADLADWPGSADPGDVDDALDVLAQLIDELDASDITYTPAIAEDWPGDADPGDTNDALDVLAAQMDALLEDFSVTIKPLIVQIGDEFFKLNPGGGTPQIVMGENDYWEFVRVSDRFTWHVGGNQPFRIWPTGALVNGYLRVGSLTLPENVTAGDLTVIRTQIGANVAFGAGGETAQALLISGEMTDTEVGATCLLNALPTLNPAGESAAEFRDFNISVRIDPDCAQDFTNVIQAIRGEVRPRGSGDYTRTAAPGALVGAYLFGAVFDVDTTDVGTIATATGLCVAGYARPSGTFTTKELTTARAIWCPNPQALDGLTLGTYIGLEIEELTRAGLNIGLRNKSTSRLVGKVQVGLDEAAGEALDVYGNIALDKDGNLYLKLGRNNANTTFMVEFPNLTSGNALVRIFRTTNTSGAAKFEVFRAAGNTNKAFEVDAKANTVRVYGDLTVDGEMPTLDVTGQLTESGEVVKATLIAPADSLVLGKSGLDTMKTPFTGKVNGNPTSTSVPYDTDSGDTSILPGMVLHNTTKSEKVKITDINSAANTITVEANSPDDANTWDDNDDITTASQTNTGRTGVYVDVDVTDFAPADTGYSAVIFEYLVRCGNAGHYFMIHPYETYSAWKEVTILTQIVNYFVYRTAICKLVWEDSRCYVTFAALSCATAHARINIRYTGVM